MFASILSAKLRVDVASVLRWTNLKETGAEMGV
jgi:hypothetical protein